MLSFLSSVVAPDVDPLTDFKHHWTAVLQYYATRPASQLKSEPVERTHLTFHLNKMLKLLVEEQASTAPGICSCLEFILGQRILDTLVTLCQADSPPGLRPYILNLFTFLLERLQYNLLPETAVHAPLRRLVTVCTTAKASPTESQEVKLLTLLTGKIHACPDLVHIFLRSPSSQPDTAVLPNTFDCSRESSGRASQDCAAQLDLANIERLAINVGQGEPGGAGHLLGAALANYLDSADYSAQTAAMEALLVVCGLECDQAAHALLNSPLLPALAARLAALAAAVPPHTEPARLDQIQVSWVAAWHESDTQQDSLAFPGQPELVGLFWLLDYWDHLARAAHHILAAGLAQTYRTELLEAVLEPLLLPAVMEEEEEERKTLLGLALVAQIWLHIRSDPLAREFCCWLLSPDLWTRLLQLLAGDGVAGLESTRLLDTLLASPCPHLLDPTITVYLETRGYHSDQVSASCWSDVEDERERGREDSPGRGYSLTLAPANIHRLVHAWLYLVPDPLRLGTDEARGAGYDQYLKDAGRQVAAVTAECAGFCWPREATPTRADCSDAGSADSRTEDSRGCVWSEGPVLSCLLDRLSTCLDSDYDSNLQLTAVLARLAALPHPHLHEYLLNPTISLGPGVRSLYSVLGRVLGRAVARSEAVPHFPLKLLSCRRRLLGDNKQQVTKEMEAGPAELPLLEAVLVLDEFCKELAAITFAKYRHFA